MDELLGYAAQHAEEAIVGGPLPAPPAGVTFRRLRPLVERELERLRESEVSYTASVDGRSIGDG